MSCVWSAAAAVTVVPVACFQFFPVPGATSFACCPPTCSSSAHPVVLSRPCGITASCTCDPLHMRKCCERAPTLAACRPETRHEGRWVWALQVTRGTGVCQHVLLPHPAAPVQAAVQSPVTGAPHQATCFLHRRLCPAAGTCVLLHGATHVVFSCVVHVGHKANLGPARSGTCVWRPVPTW